MEELMKKVTTCQICDSCMDDPKLLTCQHSFCQLCLKEHVTQFHGDSSFPCPSCNLPIHPLSTSVVDTETVAKLPSDKIAHFLCRKIQQKTPGVSSCNHAFVFFCTDCCVRICEQCKIDLHSSCISIEYINEEHLAQTCKEKLDKVSGSVNELQEKVYAMKETFFRNKNSRLMSSQTAKSKVKQHYKDTQDLIDQYLDIQEKAIIQEMNTVLDKELNYVSNSLTLNTALTENVKDMVDMLTKLKTENTQSLNACTNYAVGHKILEALRGDLEALPLLSSTANKNLEMRFIINTELEDKLMDGKYTTLKPDYEDVFGDSRPIPSAPILPLEPSTSDNYRPIPSAPMLQASVNDELALAAEENVSIQSENRIDDADTSFSAYTMAEDVEHEEAVSPISEDIETENNTDCAEDPQESVDHGIINNQDDDLLPTYQEAVSDTGHFSNSENYSGPTDSSSRVEPSAPPLT